jgi:acyl-CoA thioester hydrolase
LEGNSVKSIVILVQAKRGIMGFKHSLQVRWVDTDGAGVVHFSNYPRYFEVCEDEFYRSLGLDFKTILERYHIALPRVEMHCNYKAFCRFGDEIEISLSVREIAEKTITYDFQVFLKPDNKLAADGYLKCIAVNENWKTVSFPEELAQAIRRSSV